MKKIMVFDTETNGLNPYTNDIVQLSWEVYDHKGTPLKFVDEYVSKAVLSPYNIQHLGITQDMIDERGMEQDELLSKFFIDVAESDILVGHNIKYDTDFVVAKNTNLSKLIDTKTKICTMTTTAEFVGIKMFFGYKHPKLEELYQKLFNEKFVGAHNAINDVRATAKCFFELLRLGHYQL